MANIILFILLFIVFILPPSAGAGYDTTADVIWEYSSHGIRDSELLNILITPDDPDKIFASSFDTIYLTDDGGANWKDILSFKGADNTINSLALSYDGSKIIYAGTRDGLYISKDEGFSLKALSKGSGTFYADVLSVAVHPDNNEIVFIGTETGLFRSDNLGEDWIKIFSLPSNYGVSIVSINSIDPKIIYAASGGDLYRSVDSGINWDLIYRTGYYADRSIDEFELSDQDDISTIDIIDSRLIKSVALSPHEKNVIYIVISKRLFKSDDRGETWSSVTGFGQLSKNINHIIIAPDNEDILYSATDRGVFKYSEKSDRWEELYKGLNATVINHLATVRSSPKDPITIWAATDKGVYKTIYEAKPPLSSQSLTADEYLSYFNNEPTIQDIQKAAIRYAEVYPEKIKEWRKAAARKAWLPDLNVDFGQGKDWQSSTYFYSTSSEKYKDDDITNGKDHGWSISMTWELGDLIWNNDQTSIDTRSRLMVQLRDDVLNDVTRLYYERRRLQLEMLLYPSKLVWEKIEKELRLEELTADIDAMTGYYLSRNTKERGVEKTILQH